MPRKSDRRPQPQRLLSLHDEFVRVVGRVVRVEVETSEVSEKIDHVWIDLDVGDDGPLRLSLSTCSRQSRAAGFDPRVWVGMARWTWSELPVAGIHSSPPRNYAAMEASYAIEYAPYKRPALEELLVARAGRAVCMEAWGDLYARGNVGVHQIHSRRASFAVPANHIGRDGALQFYYESTICETLLFKFAGQP